MLENLFSQFKSYKEPFSVSNIKNNFKKRYAKVRFNLPQNSNWNESNCNANVDCDCVTTVQALCCTEKSDSPLDDNFLPSYTSNCKWKISAISSSEVDCNIYRNPVTPISINSTCEDENIFEKFANANALLRYQLRRNDREEIRRRLAYGSDNEDCYEDLERKPGRKPSLQSRLRNGKNLQICFMNETPDVEATAVLNSNNVSENKYNYSCYRNSSPASLPPALVSGITSNGFLTNHNVTTTDNNKSTYLSLSSPSPNYDHCKSLFNIGEEQQDFCKKQVQLQSEAQSALAKVQDEARYRMEDDRCREGSTSITSMLQASLKKVGVEMEGKRRVSRQLLTNMNVAQLQVIINDLHTYIEQLNERLMKMLMERDDLHMTQDAMLVDIEDLTKFLGAKQQTTLKEQPTINLGNNRVIQSNKLVTKLSRIKSFIKN